jgi:hypothetical protein
MGEDTVPMDCATQVTGQCDPDAGNQYETTLREVRSRNLPEAHYPF